VLDPAALEELATMQRERSHSDPAILEAAGKLMWARYLAQGPKQGRADLTAAIGLFAQVRVRRADIVPGPILRALDSGGPPEDEVDTSPETAIFRANVLEAHALSHPEASSLDVAISVLRGGLR
jgi:hypothetical protein